jgi:oligoribonuclease
MPKPDANNLIWMDLEMTGLVPGRDVIIEIATLVTNPDLEILAEGPELAIHRTEDQIALMDDWNVKTHTGSGLVDRIRASEIDIAGATRLTLEFVQQWTPAGKSPLCGNTIPHDRRFLRAEMSALDDHFHYRSLDVSTLKANTSSLPRSPTRPPSDNPTPRPDLAPLLDPGTDDDS